jgi:aspartate aminotransferase
LVLKNSLQYTSAKGIHTSVAAMASRFSHLEIAPPIEVFHLSNMCKEDPFPKKVNLTVGAYRTEEGKPWVLPVVRQAEKQIAADDTLDHEYFPVTGSEDLTKNAMKIMFGEDSPALAENRVVGFQGISGTGSLRIGADFLKRNLGSDIVYVSKPTWANHRTIFMRAGFSEIRDYTYWDAEKRGLALDKMCEDLRNAPEGAVVLLHGCAHNPTGVDPTPEQWKIISDVIKEKNLVPFIDIAYQGFATGNLENDAFAARHFVKEGFEFFVAQSFAKNFGLYNTRCGCLSIVLKDKDTVAKVKSQMQMVIRPMYSNPPANGARIVSTILGNPSMAAEWKKCLVTMSGRIKGMRQGLYERIKANGTAGTWEHIVSQIGMFSFTGLGPKQCEHLINKHHVYLLKNGRINMCGLNPGNLQYVADAIHDAVTNVPPQ